MLDTLKEIIKNITLIVVLAAFLEMLLPSGSTKRFLKVIIGFFIIITVLNPIFSLTNKVLQKDLEIQVGSLEPNLDINLDTNLQASSLNQVLSQGRNLREQAEAEVLKAYSERMAKQIKGVVESLTGVGLQKVLVEVGVPDQQGKMGDIEKLHIYLASNQVTGQEKPLDKGSGNSTRIPADIKVNTIKVQISQPSKKSSIQSQQESPNMTEEAEAKVHLIYKVLADIYAIPAEKVEIIYPEVQ